MAAVSTSLQLSSLILLLTMRIATSSRIIMEYYIVDHRVKSQTMFRWYCVAGFCSNSTFIGSICCAASCIAYTTTTAQQI